MFVQVFVLAAFGQRLGAALSPTPNRPPEGWDGFIKSVVGWELFLLQKVPQSARDISLADFPFKRRLTIKVFRALRSSTSRRCPLDTRFLLKRKRNFISRNWVPRGRKSGSLLHQYANWARHHAAVNWIQAQPGVRHHAAAAVGWVLMVTATRLGMQTALCSSLSSQPNPMQRWSGQSEDRKWMR